MTTPLEQERFYQAYLSAMVWADTPEELTTPPVLSDETIRQAKIDCRKFLEANADTIRAVKETGNVGNFEKAGIDFWLTRQGHGAGFWDGDWPKRVGNRLTTAAKKFGELSVYVGDDQKLYAE